MSDFRQNTNELESNLHKTAKSGQDMANNMYQQTKDNVKETANDAMQQGKNAYQQTKDNVKETANDAMQQGKNVYQQTKDTVSDTLQQGKSKIQNAYQQTRETLDQRMDDVEHFYHQTKDSACNMSEDLIEYVRVKPLTSLLVAGGIGFILSSLLKK